MRRTMLALSCLALATAGAAQATDGVARFVPRSGLSMSQALRAFTPCALCELRESESQLRALK